MPTLLVIDDDRAVLYMIGQAFKDTDVTVLTARDVEHGLELIAQKPDVVLLDIMLQETSGLEAFRKIQALDAKLPVIFITAQDSSDTAIEAMKLGAYDYLLKPFDVPKLKQIVFDALKAARAMKQVVSYQPLLESEDYDIGIVGRCEQMQNVFKLIGQLSASDATALITGESGTGKELVARAVYSHSKRASQPFLAINCAAIPENLLESELFGHERGAFSGATNQRIGKFEQCNNGTIFLDEIGDMTLATQTKILRVLQSGTFERVGGNQPVKVDVRVIAATNKPLEAAVAGKQFREDLFYRLNVIRIAMPPLRQRREDVRLLVNYFLKKFSQEQNQPPKSISQDVLSILEGYHWPGNVRELENVIRQALVVAKGDAILPTELPPELTMPPAQGTAFKPPSEPRSECSVTNADMSTLAKAMFQHARLDSKLKVIPAVERELVIQALIETQGNQVQASKLLGITRATLRKRIEKFGIKQGLAIQ